MSTSDVITPRLVAKNPPLTHKRIRRKAASAPSPLIRLDAWSDGELTPMLLNRTEIRRVENSIFDGTSIVYLMNRGQPMFVKNSLDEIEKLVAGERA